jgi:LytR cell envelope-related transcriptional attenuator
VGPNQIVQATGALAGLAALVGLAVLSALYFSHAREVKRLREWAGRVAEPSQQTVRATVARAVHGIPPSQRRRTGGQIGTRYLGIALAGLLVLGGALVSGVTHLAGGDTASRSANAPANHAGRSAKKLKRKGAVFEPGNVIVAVLNGTTVPGLAASLREQIGAAGFKRGMIGVYPDQQLVASVVQYAPGREAEARAVSRMLGISRRGPVTPSSRALSGDATVIVIAGADIAP